MEDVLIKDPKKFLEYLQASSHIDNDAEAQEVANCVSLALRNINENVNQWNSVDSTTRQTTFSLALRTYRKIVSSFNLEKNDILGVEGIAKLISEKVSKQIGFEILYAFLQSEDAKNNDAECLLKSCLQGLNDCQADEEYLIYTILRTINVLLKKYPNLEPHIKISQAYAYLQMNQRGMREEILALFSSCCKSAKPAYNYFQFILEYYPWTHRNKYLLLSCVLQSTHRLDHLLQNTGHSSEEFFNGLRLSLAYKRLLSPSQYLVKSLSRQEAQGLTELAVRILTTGTFKEITNFYSNWFNRISQKEAILKLLYERLDIDALLANFSTHSNATEEHRFVLIFSMYCRQILETSKLDFFRISTELITKCFRFQIETQLLIYKFVVDNLNCFALEDALEYLAFFIVEHRNVDNAQIRSNILAKISTIINYVSKAFRKTHKNLSNESNTLKGSITEFFSKLNELIEKEIHTKVYQPKIYTLKLLEVLLKSLFQEKLENGEKVLCLEKNAKNCNVIENEALGKFLLSKGVFDSSKITLKLIEALNDPIGFDDALDLIVQLLKRMPPSCMDAAVVTEILAVCRKCCESIDIDECSLSTRYAVVVLDVYNGKEKNSLILQQYALNKLKFELSSFQKDPLNTCKKHGHLFGFINVINVTISSTLNKFDKSKFTELLDLLELIVNLILELLMSPSTSQRNEIPVAASFQDMGKSLEFIVKNSSFRAENNEECRKFLLMSFWLTLKACCDTATTLGTLYADHERDEIDCEKLQRCFNINIAVLTRCRHKGAIEAAGVSIGKLTKHVTSHKTQLSAVNKMLYNALSSLLLNENLVSTTRRGAGFSIMFLHIVKNDEQIEKPILKHAMHEIFLLLRRTSNAPVKEINNCDRLEALSLHYLCVLAKDAELRDAIAVYRNEIILLAIRKIDDPEWTICNAALQLFGALIPKIVGQKQATELEVVDSDWEPAFVTFAEIANSMPETFEYILNYCKEHASESRFTRSIILFLGFLSKLEHLAQDDNDHVANLIFRLRELMWSLLQHREEKVRKLSALVFVRAHEFHYELPQALLTAASLLFTLHNENFFEGLIFIIQVGVLKMNNEALHTIKPSSLTAFLQKLRLILSENYCFKSEFKFYTQSKLLEMFLSVGFESQSLLVVCLINSLRVYVKQSNFNTDCHEILKKFDFDLEESDHKLLQQ